STFDLAPTTKVYGSYCRSINLEMYIRPASLSLDMFAPPSLSTVTSSPSTSSSSGAIDVPSGAQSAPVCLSPPRFDQFAHVRSPATDRFRIYASNADSAVVNSPPFSFNSLEMDKIEKDVRAVVTDLVNYILYEEQSAVERKKSMLLTTIAPPPRLPSPSRSIKEEDEEGHMVAPAATPTTPMTPSRMLSVAEELSSSVNCVDDVIVRSIVSSMVRETAKAEKMAKNKSS
ncbi:hypothetical protein PFISCL1PPCAC_3243, partial [Pristionchus fissidentatus]